MWQGGCVVECVSLGVTASVCKCVVRVPMCTDGVLSSMHSVGFMSTLRFSRNDYVTSRIRCARPLTRSISSSLPTSLPPFFVVNPMCRPPKERNPAQIYLGCLNATRRSRIEACSGAIAERRAQQLSPSGRDFDHRTGGVFDGGRWWQWRRRRSAFGRLSGDGSSGGGGGGGSAIGTRQLPVSGVLSKVGGGAGGGKGRRGLEAVADRPIAVLA